MHIFSRFSKYSPDLGAARPVAGVHVDHPGHGGEAVRVVPAKQPLDEAVLRVRVGEAFVSINPVRTNSNLKQRLSKLEKYVASNLSKIILDPTEFWIPDHLLKHQDRSLSSSIVNLPLNLWTFRR